MDRADEPWGVGVSLTCARCRRAVPEGASFCPSCGAAIGGELEVELDDATADAGAAHELVFERSAGRGRSRWAGAGVAAALAVAIGAAVASGGGGGERAGTSTTSSAADRPTTTTPVRTTAAGPSTSPPPTTTTTIAVEREAGLPLLGEPTGAHLLLTTSRGVIRLDLDAGTAEMAVPGRIPVFAEDVLAVRNGFVIWSQGTVRVVRDGEVIDDVPRVAEGGQLLGTDATGAAWLYLFDDRGPALAWVADAAAAQPVQRALVPWWPETYPNVRPDGIGGLVQSSGGGVFRWVGAQTPVGLTEGVLVDAAGGFVLTQQCYPDPACRLTVTDVRTGEARSVPVPVGELGDTIRLTPDGRWLVAPLANRDPAGTRPVVLHEIGGDRTVELPVGAGRAVNGFFRSALAWTADARWLFYVADDHRLMAWRDGLDAPIEVRLPESALTGGVAVAVGG